VTRARDEVVRAALTVDDHLDDIKRAQLWTRLEARLAPASRSRGWWRLVVPAGALAAAALVVVVVLGAGRHPIASEPASLAAPPGTTLATPLGPYARASLVGPARLELVGVGEATVARLRAGTLLAEFDGAPGRSLRVEAPGLAVVVVGTLFAVEVPDRGATCVSVAHGRVRVEPRGSIAPVFVATGERWCEGDRAIGAITPETAEALARHASPQLAAAPPAREIPAVVPPPPAPPPMVATIRPAPRVTREVSSPPPPAPRASSASSPTPVEAATPPTPAARPPAAPAPEPPAAPAPEPPAAPPPAPIAKPAPPASADTLYATAEAALARGNEVAAEHALDELIARFPASAVVDQALYERATLAYRRHAYAQAQAALAGLARVASTPLAEPGAYLACRIAVETHDSSARACIVGYRRAYPRSPHDLDLLGWLIEAAVHDGGCAAAAPLLGELGTAYGASKLAHAWRARCPERR
jgi:hypothetical protein